jgi:glycosyltransferase involved in cell wall biosynthesis
MARLRVPCVVILHTVLAVPTVRQRQILQEIAAAADRVVTMTETARERLLNIYGVDPDRIVVIPHGANDHGRTLPPASGGRSPHLLTWGLLGPGKGLEWALRALARLRTLPRVPTYTIAGKTHPKVVLEHGEKYRADLEALVDVLGIRDQVTFDPQYRDNAALTRLIRSADVVVLPYNSTEQVTSGVLIEALAAGVPVVATAFPHAVEAVTGHRGLVVPHGDSAALAGAIRRILVEPRLSGAGRAVVGDALVAPLWPVVAQRYVALARQVLADRVPATVAA